MGGTTPKAMSVPPRNFGAPMNDGFGGKGCGGGPGAPMGGSSPSPWAPDAVPAPSTWGPEPPSWGTPTGGIGGSPMPDNSFNGNVGGNAWGPDQGQQAGNAWGPPPPSNGNAWGPDPPRADSW